MGGLLLAMMIVLPAIALAPVIATWALPPFCRARLYESRLRVSIAVGLLLAAPAVVGAVDLFPDNPDISGAGIERYTSIAALTAWVSLAGVWATHRVATLAWLKTLARRRAVAPMPLHASSALSVAQTRDMTPRTSLPDVSHVTERSLDHALDRSLRVARWMVGALLAFFWAAHSAFGGLENEIGIGLVVTLATIMAVSRLRSGAEARRARRLGLPMTFQDAAGRHNWGLSTPADTRVAKLLRLPLLHCAAGETPLYPTSVTGVLDDRVVWLIEQRTNVRTAAVSRIGSVAVAHATGVWLPGVHLPSMEVSDVESAPKANRMTPVKLELEEFNRRLCASGSDPRVVSAILHPRMMQLVMKHLPAGARLSIRADGVVLRRDQPAKPYDLKRDADFVCAVADALPTWLIREATARSAVASYGL